MYDWLMQRWREKDNLIDAFLRTGKFHPADTEAVEIEGGPKEKEWKTAYINTEVMPRNPVEFLQMVCSCECGSVGGRDRGEGA